MAPKGSGSKPHSEEDLSEEGLLQQDQSKKLSATSTSLFYGFALIVSATPTWLFWRILHMDLTWSQAVLFVLMTLVSTYLVAFAYKNVTLALKCKIAQKLPEDAVVKEVTGNLSEVDNRMVSRKEKGERILRKTNQVAEDQATTFSIFYNNSLFLLLIITSFFLLEDIDPTLNYVLTISISSGLTALLSCPPGWSYDQYFVKKYTFSAPM